MSKEKDLITAGKFYAGGLLSFAVALYGGFYAAECDGFWVIPTIIMCVFVFIYGIGCVMVAGDLHSD